MKVCPKCARSFAEAMRFCPQDATELVKYDLRADLNRLGEFRFLVPTESLLARLRRECAEAIYDFKHNPKSFLAGLLRGEGSSRRRKQMLQAGVATAVMAYSAIIMTGVLIGLFKSPVQLSEAKEPEAIIDIEWVDKVWSAPAFNPKSAQAKHAANNAGKLGGSFNRPQHTGGGGGGHDNSPARFGRPPQASLLQLHPPTLKLPDVKATLIMPMTVVADPNAFLKYHGPIGDWRGKGKESSLGDAGRNGIGDDPGDGYSNGKDKNVGGDSPRFGNNNPTGTGNEVFAATASLRPTILYKERAKYTEEARQNKVQGTVVLSLIFGADGRIYDVRVVHSLPSGLTEEAILAAQKIRFAPAVRNGRPVNIRMQLEYNFMLY